MSKANVIWFTGLSGAGKTTIADALVPKIRAHGHRVETLDGDVVRTNLSKGLGFSREDRDTNIARIAFVADLLARNGVWVVVSAISPYRVTRDAARAVIEKSARFVEVYVAPPIETCIARDVKGLYKKAIAGELPGFTGIGDPYEAPLSPEARIDTSTVTVEGAVTSLAKLLDLGGARDDVTAEAE